jgi:hypothetical protein
MFSLALPTIRPPAMMPSKLAFEPPRRIMPVKAHIPVTFFAPAERVPIKIVHRQAASFRRLPVAGALLDSVLDCTFVLNAQRQIVFASRSALSLVPGKTPQDILGRRPGEALDCIYAEECEGGCGTSAFCRRCGAVRAILAGLSDRRDLQECHLTRWVRGRQAALDLLVLATPLLCQNERFVLVSVADISRPERRQALRCVFPLPQGAGLHSPFAPARRAGRRSLYGTRRARRRA